MKIVVTALCLIGIISCNKDEDDPTNCQRLEGTWAFTSWQEDGEEFLGDSIYIISSTLEFKALDEGMGDFEWSLEYIIGGNETIIGAYRPDDQCTEVTITPKGGVPSTYSFTINGDQLVLETEDNNVLVQFTLEKE